MIPSFMVTGKPYEFMKWLVLIVLPAVGAAYFGLSGTLGLPNSEQVVGTLAIVTTFLGTILGISSHNYNQSDVKYDGVINMEPSAVEPNKWVYDLALNDEVESLADMKQVTFKVDSPILGP